jgi:hypothetical protein
MSHAVPALRPSDPLLDVLESWARNPLRAFELVPFENADALPAKRSDSALALQLRPG